MMNLLLRLQLKQLSNFRKKIIRIVQPSPRRSPRRRNITATLEDGTTITIPENMLDRLTMATRGPSSS